MHNKLYAFPQSIYKQIDILSILKAAVKEFWNFYTLLSIL